LTPAGEGLVFHLLPDAGDFNVGDGFGGLDEGAGGEEAGQLIAGKERLVEVGDARRAGVLGVAEDGSAHLLGQPRRSSSRTPTKGVPGARVTLVIEVMEEGGGGVEIDERAALGAGEAEAIGFRFPVGDDAGFDREGVLAQVFALGPFPQQGEGLRTPILVFHAHVDSCCTIWFVFLWVLGV